MAILNANPAATAPTRLVPGTLVGSGAGAASPGNAFGKVWSEVKASTSQVEVQSGDTLIGLVKAHYRQQGLPISETDAYRLAHQVAADNGIRNPDLIEPGQSVDFGRLNLPPLARAAPTAGMAFTTAEQALANRYWRTASSVPGALTPDGALGNSPASSGLSSLGHASGSTSGNGNPVLEQTLARAVDKGFIQANDLPAVRSRILSLADRYRFSPDDFARLSLMESGGMNPRASNGRCHGVIQFCDGPGRGAASVGFRDNPRAILDVPLLQQLDLVDRYFSQVGLQPDKGQDRLSLDELYLSILTPAARSEKRRDVALDIPGPQASYLHVERNRQKPITRDSLTAGLYAYTNAVLQGANARSAAQQFALTDPPVSAP